MTITEFKTNLKTTPTAITFKETMQVIEDYYTCLLYTSDAADE